MDLNSCFSDLSHSAEFYRMHLHKERLTFPRQIDTSVDGLHASVIQYSNLVNGSTSVTVSQSMVCPGGGH